MNQTFKTFVRKDRSEFIGLSEQGEMMSCESPIMILQPNASLEDCLKHFYFIDDEEKQYFIDNTDLVKIAITEI